MHNHQDLLTMMAACLFTAALVMLTAYAMIVSNFQLHR